MIYDKIVIGATFVAAGLIANCDDNCLVIEPKSQAGHEFLGALEFGTAYNTKLSTNEAVELAEQFRKRGAFLNDKACLFECASVLYSIFLNKNLLISTSIVDIKKENDVFYVTAHSVKGFNTYMAKQIINTLCDDDDILTKSFNAWVRPKEKGVTMPKTVCADSLFGAFEGTYIIKLPVLNNCTYQEARGVLDKALKNELCDFRLGLSADYFAVKPKNSGVYVKEDIIKIPSCGFDNPLLAFEAGVKFAKGAVK